MNPFLALSGFLAYLTIVQATSRGLAWAEDDRFSPVIGGKPLVNWYHHWADGIVKQMPAKVEWVPMFHSAKTWDKWNQRKNDIKSHPITHLMGFNEPDILTQANMDPEYAAQVWMQEIHPYAAKGVQLGSPAIAYNLDWMTKFLAALKKKGGHIDFMCIHWYGSWKDLAGFKAFVTKVHNTFGYHLWITELGITTASYPSQTQTKQFMMNAYSWMDQQGFVDRAAWFGCFEVAKPPDSYATGLNALFKTAGILSDMGFWYGYTTYPDRRRDLRSRHHTIAARNNATAADEQEADVPVHCDKLCQLRNEQLQD